MILEAGSKFRTAGGARFKNGDVIFVMGIAYLLNRDHNLIAEVRRTFGRPETNFQKVPAVTLAGVRLSGKKNHNGI